MYHGYMVPNARFWAHYYRGVYVPAIQGFHAGALEKVAPAFGGIAEEAAAAAEAAREENGSFQTAELEKRLAACGVECRSFARAGKLYKLRMAANAIKHGAGPSASELAKLRPDLFLNPVLSRLGWAKKGDDAKSPRAAVLASSFVAPLACGATNRS